jgi:hypothetical protein
MRTNAIEGAGLILLHEPAVADDIGRHDRGKLPLHGSFP